MNLCDGPIATLLAIISPLTSPKTKTQSELMFAATKEFGPTLRNQVKFPFTVPLKNKVPSNSTSALLKILALLGKIILTSLYLLSKIKI